MAEAVYEKQGAGLFATGLARGPWDDDAQHGGAPAAVLMRAFESCEPSDALAIARVTYELLRPVPLGELHASASIMRPGRRVQLLEGSLVTPDGTEVVRARALRVARADVEAGADGPAPPGPENGRPGEFALRGELERFPTDAMEIRFIAGGFHELGPSTAWFRLRVPIVDGEEPSGLQRLAAAADFPNGIASEVSWEDYVFINPDLTVYVEREPVGEWICLDARMRVTPGGAGSSEAVLYDAQGRVGRSLQSLYVARRG